MKLFGWLFNGRDRVEGLEACAWYNGYFTKNRTDLPFPS